METRELRSEKRIALSRPATLTVRGNAVDGGKEVPCMVQNICSRGFLILCTQRFPIGEVIDLKCQLFPQRALECRVEVRHINKECLGAKVVEISDAAMSLCRKFLKEHGSENS